MRTRIDNLLFGGATLLMLALLLPVGAALLYRSGLHYQINYNEGWNSYFVGRVLDGLPLYPARSTRLINNYPPLSFYLVAGASELTGSVLTAGRAVAWAGYLGSAALIGLVLRRLGGSAGGAWFGALFFAAALAIRCDLYVGMFDPQLPAQALMLAGLAVLLRGGAGRAVLAAALIVAGGFIKHSLIALPISVSLWLLLYRRRQFVPFVGAALGLAGAGLAACAAVFGPEFIAGLTMPRPVDWSQAVRKVVKWLLPLEPACLLALLPALLGGAEGALVGIYLAVSLATALAGAAPAATNYNMIFELLVAVSLGLGLLVGRFSPRVPRGWVALASAACLALTAVELATAETASPRRWLERQARRDAEAQRLIAGLRAVPGPALCGTLLYCYQAGKPFVWDPLNYGLLPGETQAGLRADLASRRFAVVQQDADNMYFSAETRAAIEFGYESLSETPGLFVPLR